MFTCVTLYLTTCYIVGFNQFLPPAFKINPTELKEQACSASASKDVSSAFTVPNAKVETVDLVFLASNLAVLVTKHIH